MSRTRKAVNYGIATVIVTLIVAAVAKAFRRSDETPAVV